MAPRISKRALAAKWPGSPDFAMNCMTARRSAGSLQTLLFFTSVLHTARTAPRIVDLPPTRPLRPGADEMTAVTYTGSIGAARSLPQWTDPGKKNEPAADFQRFSALAVDLCRHPATRFWPHASRTGWMRPKPASVDAATIETALIVVFRRNPLLYHQPLVLCWSQSTVRRTGHLELVVPV